ncbi:MAG TPA: ABC transporter permease [Blastocatellia bacterium]|nr:ABC transporter permease [Blastocatellia bacterium]
MNSLTQDIRFSFRMLLKRPGFTVIVVLALALGIGANTAIFTVINAVLLRPLPYKNPDRLVWLRETCPGADIKDEPASPPNFMDWKAQGQSFDEMGAFVSTMLTLTSSGEPERIPAAYVTDGFFSVIGAEAAAGRTFTPEEDKPGGDRVVVISHGLFERRFGSDPNIVGSAITINGNPYTVVGVMPRDFKNPKPNDRNPPDVWAPLAVSYYDQHRRGDYLSVIARLKPGVSVEQARAEMAAITGRLEQQYPDTNTGWGATVTALHERFVGDVRPALIFLLGAVCFLLLIACANVANLLLARSTARQKEIAIRTALGARRGRIVQQLLTESVLLSLAGGVLGLLLAFWGVEVLTSLGAGSIPRLSEISVDGRVFGFTLSISLFTGIIFGLLPALQASNPNLNETLKEGGRSSIEGARSGNLRGTLAAIEIALALMLLIGAGLMVRSFVRLQNVDAGFNPKRVLTAGLFLPASKYKEGPQVTAFYNELLGRVEALPGVESAGAIDSLPLSGSGSVEGFVIEGRLPQQPSDNIADADYRVVSPDYFRTIGIALLRGRLLTEQDGQNAPWALVINDTMARRYFPDEDPIGKRINMGDPQKSPWRTIVGVVRDTRDRALGEEPYSQMYAAHTQITRRGLYLVLRTSSDPMSLVSAIRSQVADMDRELPLSNVRTMEQVLAESIARPRFNMLLITIFAVVAVVLASVGVYGVISYSVSQRTHEIGVRIALGARPGDIFRMVLSQGLKLSLAGVGVGLVAAFALAFALTRVMSGLLYEVRATDPVTFAVIPLALTALALLASYIPARRATRVDPMISLRYE